MCAYASSSSTFCSSLLILSLVVGRLTNPSWDPAIAFKSDKFNWEALRRQMAKKRTGLQITQVRQIWQLFVRVLLCLSSCLSSSIDWHSSTLTENRPTTSFSSVTHYHMSNSGRWLCGARTVRIATNSYMRATSDMFDQPLVLNWQIISHRSTNCSKTWRVKYDANYGIWREVKPKLVTGQRSIPTQYV